MRSVLGAALMAALPAALAQDLPRPMMPPVNDPVLGRSAHAYGMPDPDQQEASIRSVLSSVQLDRAYLPSSLAAESAFFLVRMFVGGQGAPTDLADPRQDALRGAARD